MNPDASIVIYTSDIVILAESDTKYFVASRARSCTTSFTYMGNHTENKHIINGPIMVIARTLEMVMASAAKAKVGA